MRVNPSIGQISSQYRFTARPSQGLKAEPAVLGSIQSAPQADSPAAGVTMRGTQAPTASPSTILQHWGTSNAEADLNADGIVDAQDLTLALSNPTPTPQEVVTQNWGSSGDSTSANGDYNGDGTVDAMDLTIALSGAGNRSAQAGQGEQNVAGMVQRIVDATFAARDRDGDGAISKADFRDKPRAFSRLDLDQSGTLSRNELTKALSAEFDRFREQFPNSRVGAFARRWTEALAGGAAVPDAGRFQRIEQMFSRPSAQARASAQPQILSVRA